MLNQRGCKVEKLMLHHRRCKVEPSWRVLTVALKRVNDVQDSLPGRAVHVEPLPFSVSDDVLGAVVVIHLVGHRPPTAIALNHFPIWWPGLEVVDPHDAFSNSIGAE